MIIAQNLFIGYHNILVEGRIGRDYLAVLSSHLNSLKGASLPESAAAASGREGRQTYQLLLHSWEDRS